MARVARVTAVLGAATAAFAASCFSKPDAPHAGGDARDPDSMMTDGMGTGTGTGTDGATNLTCPSGVWDNFESGTQCMTWGTGFGSGSSVPIVRTGGKLQTVTNGMGNVYCQTNSAIPIAKGISIEIPQIALSSTMHAGTFFRVRPSAGSSESFEVHINDNMNNTTMSMLNCSGTGLSMVPFSYSPTLHRWWKFEVHPSATGQFLHVYSGSNGDQWADTNTTCTWTASSTNVVVEMGVEGFPGGSTALFDNFNTKTCP